MLAFLPDSELYPKGVLAAPALTEVNKVGCAEASRGERERDLWAWSRIPPF